MIERWTKPSTSAGHLGADDPGGCATRSATGDPAGPSSPSAPTTPRSRISGTRSPPPSGSRAGSCRSAATCASAVATSSRAMPAVRSRPAMPPHRLAMTWEFGGDVSWVDVRLTEVGGGTHLVLEHAAHVTPEWEERGFGPGAVGIGWDMMLLGLAHHVAIRRGDRPGRGRWRGRASDEGQGVHARAAATPGAPPTSPAGTAADVARAAADRTIEAYTAERLMHAFDVLGDPVRRRILELLAERRAHLRRGRRRDPDGVRPVAARGVQHLRVLRENGFANVRPTARGGSTPSRPTAPGGRRLARSPSRRFWEQRLDALD